MTLSKIKRALLSVYDKTGIVDLAQTLIKNDIEILSTGGTFSLLHEQGIPAVEVSSITEFPEMMNGRVKTLHPRIQGGILARRDQDQAELQKHKIPEIDLVVVNLYPFVKTITQPGVTFDSAIENIDIGGPTMIRAAAKNCTFVTVLTDPSDYATFTQLIEQNSGGVPEDFRKRSAAKAFAHTAYYDANIARYFSQFDSSAYPETFTPAFIKQGKDLRYGENPHQNAALYADPLGREQGVATAPLIQGKALSFNNLADADAAFVCVNGFEKPACVIVKHANPCGVAIADTLETAYSKAYRTDPVSAFGGIIAFNRTVGVDTIQLIFKNQFVEVIIAPQFTQEALNLLTDKPNIRVLACSGQASAQTWDCKKISGGLLVQSPDCAITTPPSLQVVTHRQPAPDELADLLFAWNTARYVKSNAIVYASGGATLGIGAGQMSRVDSAKIAAIKAEEQQLSLADCVMASDAFFPFRDGIDLAAKAGVKAIIQPGGSMRDSEVIAAANEADIAMVFTGIRHFKH